MAPDLARSEQDVCVRNLLVASVCHSVGRERTVTHTHSADSDRTERGPHSLGRDDDCDGDSEQGPAGRRCCVVATHLEDRTVSGSTPSAAEPAPPSWSWSYLGVVHPFSQPHRVDADVDVATLVHQLQVGGALDPGGGAGQRQVELQGDPLRVP